MMIASSDSFGLCIAKKKAKLIQKKILKTKIAGATLVGGASVAAAAAAVLQQQQQQNSNFTIYQPPLKSLNDQTIVITGGSSGLGLESAKRLALAGANIIITARTEAKGQAAIEAVETYVENKNENPASITYKVLELDDFESIRQVDWSDVPKIDVLLNNAGVMALPERELTVDGYERQMQSNHFGHFLLTSLLAGKMSKRARIINVSSSAHQSAFNGLKFDYSGKRYGPYTAYGQSKLANIYFTRELQRRIDAAPGIEWTSATLHPGVISSTNLFRYQGPNTSTNKEEKDKSSTEKKESNNFFSNLAASVGFKTVPQGASTQVWLASGGAETQVGGQYYDNCQSQPLAPFCLNIEDGKRLWKDSEEIVGQSFDLETIAAVSSLMKEEDTIDDEVISSEEDDASSEDETSEKEEEEED